MTESEIIERSLQGDGSAFGILVQKYYGAVYGIAFHLLRNFDDAQDITQDVFIEAFQKLEKLRDHSRFSAWLRSVTVNLCKMQIRKHKATVPIDILTNESQILQNRTLTPAEEFEIKEVKNTVTKIIDSLPEKDRLIVTLYYMDDLSYQEIASFLSLSVSVVKVRMYRAKRKLKEEMIGMVKETFANEVKRQPEFSVKELLEAGVHFGHHTEKRNSNMSKYILTERNGIDIIDLSQTLRMIKDAYNFVRDESTKGRVVLFVGMKESAQQIIEEQAKRCGMPFISSEDQSIELSKLERSPDVIFVIDVEKEKKVLSEAKRLKIPIIAVIDSINDPESVDYPIAGNDDAKRSIQFICTKMADAVIEGNQKR